jgi:hypothetical protein
MLLDDINAVRFYRLWFDLLESYVAFILSEPVFKPDSNRGHFLGVLAKKCEKRLLASSCLSVRMEQFGSNWADFHEI